MTAPAFAGAFAFRNRQDYTCTVIRRLPDAVLCYISNLKLSAIRQSLFLRMPGIKNYLSLIKFSHTIFALPFAMIGFCLGLVRWNDFTGYFSGSHVVMQKEITNGYLFPQSIDEIFIRFCCVLICMISARSAAMAFNRYLDRNFDAKNPRTAIREIPAGIIKASGVLYFTIISCIIFIAAAWFINPLCFWLSPVALFVVLFYSYTKRFTALCHIVLGIGLSLAPIGAFLAVTGHFEWQPLFFSFAVIAWVSGFDIIYALQDEQFDKANQLYSIPARLGLAKGLKVSEILHLISFVFIIAAGLYGKMGLLYWTGATIFGGMLIYQHRLVKPGDLSRVNMAFMTTNGIASVVFAIFVISDLLIILF